jgi:Polyketide cyclase / dehydrase and lipid transport
MRAELAPTRTRAMATFQTTTTVVVNPQHVLDVLTDPDRIAVWSPIAFELEEFDGDRLRTGSQARVTGRLAGRRLSFDVEIIEAEGNRLALRATGPVELDVEYDVEQRNETSELRALVSVRSAGGLLGRVISGATEGLLGAGMLNTAVARIAREAEARPAPALAA